MHSIRGSWTGQVFAVASGNDTEGKRTRIRRSKEERKGMVETFIKKYQTKNEGNFPSLNLTHKEVGGSFYTVREIVREIIQENRVLAPPKESFEEYDNSGFLEHHPLGFLLTEPQSDFSLTDAIHTLPSENPIRSEHGNVNDGKQLHGHGPLELDNERFLNGVSHGLDDSAPNHYKHTSAEEQKDKLFIPNSEEESGIDITVNGEKTIEIGQQISLDSVIMEVMEREEDRANSMQRVGTDVVVETFPVRPVSSSIVDMDAGSGNLHEVAIDLEDDATQHKKITIDHSSFDVANHTDSVKEHDLKDPLPDGIKVDSSVNQLTAESDDSIPKGSNPTLDRINLGTWEGSSKNSHRRDSNPILATVKAFISAFVKFWTE